MNIFKSSKLIPRMITIDGAEAGGALLRHALAFSTLTQQPFKMVNIRKSRPKPGLKAQHLTCLIAYEQMSGSTVMNAEIGSDTITFIPGTIKNKTVDLDIGTAGSITLLLQSVLMPCVFSEKTVTFHIKGGTDVKWSPNVDYFANVVLPHFAGYADINFRTMKRGYYPKGQGEVSITIRSKTKHDDLIPLDLMSRGDLLQIKGISHASSELLERNVADRQAKTAEVLLSDLKVPVNILRQYSKTESTGSAITLWAMFSKPGVEISQPIIVGSDELGAKDKKSEEVSRNVVKKLKYEINKHSVIDKYLADMLVPLLAITKGCLRTSEITNHTLANMKLAEEFFNVKFSHEETVIYAKTLKE